MSPLLECVPNVSNGRDPEVIRALAEAFASAGASLLGVDSDADHHRSVITIAGPAEAVVEGAVRGVRAARDAIDLNHHQGAHPRMGAADVVPFVPLGSATMADAVAAARTAGARIWAEAGVPVYLYGEAATRPERANLAALRKGGFEGIRATIETDPARRPDFGSAAVHPTAGITAVGARFFLIAFNVNLATRQLPVAQQIAGRIRERDGGLPGVKALGFDLPERGQVQVSMNLVDFRRTSPIEVFEVIRDLAAAQGVAVAEGEVVGLIPEAACPPDFETRVMARGFVRDEQVIERRLARAGGAGA